MAHVSQKVALGSRLAASCQMLSQIAVALTKYLRSVMSRERSASGRLCLTDP